jgi:hypothetical protein
MPIPARRGSRPPAVVHRPPEPRGLRRQTTDDGHPTSIDQFIPGLYRPSAIVFDRRQPTPDTWNLERPACFEIVPTAARSGASRQICTARDRAISRHRACARVAAMTHSRASTGRLCAALDFHPAQSPERSPLHDVRQHAPGQANPTGCEIIASGRAAHCPRQRG